MATVQAPTTVDKQADSANTAVNAQSSSMKSLNATSKKQLFMSQRAERLKDPKVRQMGIDREALDHQVREQHALRQLEKDRDAYFDRQALLMDRHACALQQEVNGIRAAREKQLLDYRDTFQKKELGREWDLNDPHAKAKALPARVGDDDPRNGPSSLQKFDGEDLDYKERRAAQQRQQQSWAQQQVEEKLAKKWMEREANHTYDERNEDINNRTHLIEQHVAAQRRLMDRNTAAFNRALEEQQRAEAARTKAEDERRGLEEVAYHLGSDFLNERETVIGELGKSVKSERYKGLSAEQTAKLRAEQDEQLQLLRRRRLLEVEEEQQWAQQEHMQLRMAKALDRQQARDRRAERLALEEERKTQAAAAAERKAYLKELFTNAVDEDYYKHWDQCM